MSPQPCLHNLPAFRHFSHFFYISVCFVLLRKPEAKIFAHLYAGVEGFDAEVDGAVNISKVGKLDPGKEVKSVSCFFLKQKKEITQFDLILTRAV